MRETMGMVCELTNCNICNKRSRAGTAQPGQQKVPMYLINMDQYLMGK